MSKTYARWIGIGSTILLLLNDGISFANGFKILGVKSTKATAMGEAFIAQADDPSAIAFNPAGLTQVKGTQTSMQLGIMNAWTECTTPQWTRESNKDKWQVVSGSYISSDFGMENVVFGLGLTVPNGLSSEWSKRSFARYVDTYSNLFVLDVNPSLGYQINEQFSVGAGLSYYYSLATLESMIDYGNLIGAPGSFDGKSKLNGSGDAWGGNVGILYKFNPRHHFGFTYKSPYTIDYQGKIRLTNIPAFMGLGSETSSHVHTSIKFPAVIVFGYAYYPTEKLKLEWDIDWTQWERCKEIRLEMETKNLLLNDVTNRYDYHNTFVYKFGMEYAATERLKLRFGYMFDENATPQSTWRPSLPDTKIHFVCSGFGYQMGKWTIDTALQLAFYEKRKINNNVDNNETLSSSSIDGTYRTFGTAFSLGLTYKF